MPQPEVSVIIPVYKAASHIARCVHSLFGQTLGGIEYIFIDDCSPDDSITVMEEVFEMYTSPYYAYAENGKLSFLKIVY